MIVKIQRPLSGGEPNPPALVYDRTRRYQALIPLTADVLALLGTKPKVYAEAEIVGGQLRLGARVAPQPW